MFGDQDQGIQGLYGATSGEMPAGTLQHMESLVRASATGAASGEDSPIGEKKAKKSKSRKGHKSMSSASRNRSDGFDRSDRVGHKMARRLGEAQKRSDREVGEVLGNAMRQGKIRSVAMARSVHGHSVAAVGALIASRGGGTIGEGSLRGRKLFATEGSISGRHGSSSSRKHKKGKKHKSKSRSRGRSKGGRSAGNFTHEDDLL